ncbi:hypothetical protein ACFWXK_01830 [Streptomyces sp. NPDC059070]|uniref:hypothetical protein n=1 Tax=Streptomyces sp. NPDC059070 TaxID=3346713 RepID=UPI00368E4BB9
MRDDFGISLGEDRNAGLRLLPWTRPDGNPCYLRTDDNKGHLSRLADEAEQMLLDMAETMLPLAERALADPEVHRDDLISLGTQLTQCLHDTLRVAVSRGGRLARPATTGARGAEDDGPELPAEACG